MCLLFQISSTVQVALSSVLGISAGCFTLGVVLSAAVFLALRRSPKTTRKRAARPTTTAKPSSAYDGPGAAMTTSDAYGMVEQPASEAHTYDYVDVPSQQP